MKVILLEDVKSLGKKGQIVDVSDGYARNFILAKKLGLEATSKNLNDLKLKKAHEDKLAAQRLQEAKDFAAKLEGLQVTLTRCAPPAVLFGDAIGHEHKHKSRQDPRSDARQEKFTHGSLPRNAIDHERITGRDHDADGARARHDRSCEHLVVTAFRHRRDGQRADGRHGGGPRTADCGEEHARGDTGESDPAG